jgi:diguanylate cyclase (GGDEF)-like protein
MQEAQRFKEAHTAMRKGHSMMAAEILIVEDSPTQAEQLRCLLEKHGYTVEIARSGEEALELIGMSVPALVISDIVMPGMDGYELCRILHQNPYTWTIPVILLTQLDSSRDILRALESGADSFIAKTSGEEHLIAKIVDINRGIGGDTQRLTFHNNQVAYCGENFNITAGRERILSLLISTYEAAVSKNKELMTAQNELKELNLKLEIALEEVRDLSLHDPLTGLSNRRMLDIGAAGSLARAQRTGDPFGVIMLDIDLFKKYNDTYGHDAGDRILEQMAEILGKNIRITDLAVRYGGEEFLILLNDFEIEGTLILAERLRSCTQNETGITASLGIAWFQADSTFDAVVKRADEALYTAKHNGRNRLECFEKTK